MGKNIAQGHHTSTYECLLGTSEWEGGAGLGRASARIRATRATCSERRALVLGWRSQLLGWMLGNPPPVLLVVPFDAFFFPLCGLGSVFFFFMFFLGKIVG